MALSITKNKKAFEVKGRINATTASFFKTHFINALNSKNGLSIDINNVTEIDSNGMRALKELYSKAKTYKKPFYILGNGCKEIFDELRIESLA
ncbi:STAS domain-containing protein [Mesoflavibacter zeaxanthinifaciens]|uniref:STAS domain-containing protein n=1 Tax=Mesoflavibacter zeaxanthinifaciens TaxID=393060 RepID=UPI003A927649